MRHASASPVQYGYALGSPVPTIKVSTNAEVSRKKPGWIDFDAGVLTTAADRIAVDEAFAELAFAVAGGTTTLNELHDQRDIGIFKGGVVL